MEQGRQWHNNTIRKFQTPENFIEQVTVSLTQICNTKRESIGGLNYRLKNETNRHIEQFQRAVGDFFSLNLSKQIWKKENNQENVTLILSLTLLFKNFRVIILPLCIFEIVPSFLEGHLKPLQTKWHKMGRSRGEWGITKEFRASLTMMKML